MAELKRVGQPEITFCVSVQLKKGEQRTEILKNTIRRFPVTYSWFDVFDIAVENHKNEIHLPDSAFEKFEKIATVSVSSSNSTEKYSPSVFDKISVLTDFDSNLKYVVIDLDVTDLVPKDPVCSETQPQSAFDLIMGNKRRQPQKIPTDKQRFTGGF